MIKFEEITYKTFGRCISMSNGTVELLVTLDLGPRIIRFSRIGGENLMMENGDFSINQDANAPLFAEKFGADLGTFRNYGGHRLWASPEAMPRTYYPDNEPVGYHAEGNCLTLTPPPQRWNAQQLEMKILMAESGTQVDIYHTITNLGAWPQKIAPWAISMLAAGGTEVIPMPQRPSGFLHNRKIALWDYTKMNDPRIVWGDRFILVKQDKTIHTPLKFGIDSQHGWSAYFNFGDVFLKRFDLIDGAEYPDGGMNFETYACADFIEMESLGEYRTINPNESISHHERWEVIQGLAYPGPDETAIADALTPYIG